MKRAFLPIFAALAASGCATMPNETAQGPDPRLTAALEGRVAGKPQHCLPLNQATGSEIFRDAILYRESRNRFWVADAPGCGSTRSTDDILVQQVWGSQLCSGDIIHQVDRISHITGGACGIRSFTPYTKVKG